MILRTNISRLFGLRAILVIGALISLCASSNVGPQFLPLPCVLDRGVESRLENQPNTASRLPYSGQCDSFRVPMMAQTHRRFGTTPPPHSLATPLDGDSVHPDDIRSLGESSYAIVHFTSAPSSEPPGRAPPRLL
jgi:hypothetical protein